MKMRICAPRIFGRAIFAGLTLLISTVGFAHNPNDNGLADDPAVAALLQYGQGQAVQLEGQMEIVHQDFKDGHGRFLFTLKQVDGTRVPLKFAKHPPTHLLSGDHVRANGRLSNGNLLLYSGSNVKQTGGGSTGGTVTPSIPVPNTLGPQSTLVMLVNFLDDTIQPYTVADAQNMFFNTASNFFTENSYGQTSITGTIVGWYTIPDSVTTCNMSQMASDARNAATAAGVNLSSYTRYVYAFPDNGACGWAGSSTVGGNPSESWINQSTPDSQTIHHELGHALGLWHSHSLDCGLTAAICSSGNVVEYGDRLDTMGTPQTASPHYNAFQKERLGWLNYGASPAIQTVTSSGTYTIGPYEAGGSGPAAVKILKSTNSAGVKTWYYLEARQALGFDSFLADSIYYTQNETAGVLVHQGTDGDGNSSQLLDMTPATPTSRGWFDASLATGQSFDDSTDGLSITPTNVSSAGATLEITMNGSACTKANPGVAVSPSQSQAVTSGTSVNFSITVTDNDSSSCAPATFNLSDVLPSGSWSGQWNTAVLPLSPGKSGSVTLTVASPAGTADGYYTLAIFASDASANTYAASSSATYLVSAPAAQVVSVATNQTSYLPGQTVSITVTMADGTVPEAGTNVAVTVTTPGGKGTTLNGTTGSNGVALINYKLSRRAATGTYQVQAGTSVLRTASVAGASTSFSVQ